MKGWKWTAPMSMFGFALMGVVFITWMELPYLYTEFRHGLAFGIGLVFLAETVRERALGWTALALLNLVNLAWATPRPRGGGEAATHVLAGLLALVVVIEGVRRWRSRPSSSAPLPH